MEREQQAVVEILRIVDSCEENEALFRNVSIKLERWRSRVSVSAEGMRDTFGPHMILSTRLRGYVEY